MGEPNECRKSPVDARRRLQAFYKSKIMDSVFSYPVTHHTERTGLRPRDVAGGGLMRVILWQLSYAV